MGMGQFVRKDGITQQYQAPQHPENAVGQAIRCCMAHWPLSRLPEQIDGSLSRASASLCVKSSIAAASLCTPHYMLACMAGARTMYVSSEDSAQAPESCFMIVQPSDSSCVCIGYLLQVAGAVFAWSLHKSVASGMSTGFGCHIQPLFHADASWRAVLGKAFIATSTPAFGTGLQQ